MTGGSQVVVRTPGGGSAIPIVIEPGAQVVLRTPGPQGETGPPGPTGPTGPQGADGATVEQAAKADAAMLVVAHGAVGSTARPAGAPAVYWIGSAEPVNAVDGDQWTVTA